MNVKTERFEMRLDDVLLERIDTWRRKQDDLPSRAEAVRRLTEVGLATLGDKSLVLNNSDKLIVALLCEMHNKMKINQELDPGFIQSAIYGGHFWSLQWKYGGLLNSHYDNERTLDEVVDILDMWSFLESAYAGLSKKDKDYVQQNAESGKDVRFEGFDGNNENKHLTIAHFLIEEMGRFSDFKDRGDLNSHYPIIEVYRRMLNVFIPVRKTLVGRNLNAKEIVEILKERVHPTMREKLNK